MDETSKALARAAQLPFFGEPSDEASRAFQELFETVGMSEVFASLEQPTTVTVLGKLGAMHEAAKTAAEKKSKQLSNTQLKIRGLQATTSNRQKNAKKQALLKLDEEDQKSLQQKRNTRRRMIWKQLMEKRGKQPRKRIQESFDGMDPKRVYRPKLSIQDRLEVVEWVLKKKKEMQDPEPCEPDSNAESLEEEEESNRAKKRRGSTCRGWRRSNSRRGLVPM